MVTLMEASIAMVVFEAQNVILFTGIELMERDLFTLSSVMEGVVTVIIHWNTVTRWVDRIDCVYLEHKYFVGFI